MQEAGSAQTLASSLLVRWRDDDDEMTHDDRLDVESRCGVSVCLCRARDAYCFEF